MSLSEKIVSLIYRCENLRTYKNNFLCILIVGAFRLDFLV
jgi:hypothetical protein